MKERPDAKTVELHDNIQQAVVDFEHDKKATRSPLRTSCAIQRFPCRRGPTPTSPRPSEGTKWCSVYTDLEPDDIFAIACYLQSTSTRPCAPPVVVFTADLGVKG